MISTILKIQNKRFIEHEFFAIFEFLKYRDVPVEFDFDKKDFPFSEILFSIKRSKTSGITRAVHQNCLDVMTLYSLT